MIGDLHARARRNKTAVRSHQLSVRRTLAVAKTLYVMR
jgi:hypothetical protein